MAGKTDYLSNAWLKLLFQAIPIANIADNASASPLTQLYLSLHTADPGDAPVNGQSQYEANYVGYARIALSRSTGGWAVVGKAVSPQADIILGRCTNGVMTITHAGVGTAPSGAGILLYSGAVSPQIATQPGVRPIIEAGSTITEE